METTQQSCSKIDFSYVKISFFELKASCVVSMKEYQRITKSSVPPVTRPEGQPGSPEGILR